MELPALVTLQKRQLIDRKLTHDSNKYGNSERLQTKRFANLIFVIEF